MRLLWDERGKGYYGEYLVFRELYLYIPGYYKLVFNVEIPNVNGTKTTGIDALMLHETGIYSIEVKHYKGTIYGKVEDQKWTQFFKTTDNSHFNNPVKQNEWHIAAIKSMFPASDVSLFVVFTSDDCELKVTGSKPNTTICYLRELQYNLTEEIKRKQKIYSVEQLGGMFQQLNGTYKGLAPKDIVRIKMSGGGENYVHGGISLQEMMIPVITYDNVRADSKEYKEHSSKYSNSYAKIQLVGDNRKISNSIFTLNFYQSEAVGGNVLPATYEIYMADSNGKVISDVQSIIANKEDKDSSNRQFKVRLTLKPLTFSKTELYYLMVMNKDNGQALDRIEYQINISFSSDFDF